MKDNTLIGKVSSIYQSYMSQTEMDLSRIAKVRKLELEA